MPWRDGLSDEQQLAAGHVGNHARLLAGPGTGKTRTLTHRILALVLEHGIDPRRILALTFTRVAAFDLGRKVRAVLEPRGMDPPRVSTLHSFALRQLLRNIGRVDTLPQPLRIADDWEERHIIQEDIRERMGTVPGRPGPPRIREVQELFRRLSADWETLEAETADWEGRFPDPAFLQSWREHRAVFGYTLRAEMVYQLKRALNQYPDFGFDQRYRHVLIDEYQDLNACDLAVVREMANRGAEIFAAGDDDQSIYGFRGAEPEGIRQFTEEYRPSSDLTLTTCYRCDRSILRIAEFVANLDTGRQPKHTVPVHGAGAGEVRLLRFRSEQEEALGIARACDYLTNVAGVRPDQILVLLRSDTRRALSSIINARLADCGIPSAAYVDDKLTDTTGGRMVLALLRLLVDAHDDLAWRTALQLTTGIGVGSLRAAEELARVGNMTFAEALASIKAHPEAVERVGQRLSRAAAHIDSLLAAWSSQQLSLEESVRAVGEHVSGHPEERARLIGWLGAVAEEAGASSLEELLKALAVSLDQGEQELEPGAVNILTMHKAKGLNVDVVFIAAAEDEFLPGRNEGQREGDERRLLFVSMTRARHRLFITYCRLRTGQQARLGRPTGRPTRCLTRFLRDAPIEAEDGSGWISTLANQVT